MRRDLTTALYGVVLLLVVAFLWWEGSRQDFNVLGEGVAFDPMFFPRLLMALGALCAAGIAVSGLARRRTETPPVRWGLLAGIVVLSGAFFWAFGAAGFPVAASVFIVAFSVFLGYRDWVAILLTALGVAAGVWFVFTEWLLVPLPASSWLAGLV